MAEVMFEWADGPNANAEFHHLYIFSPLAEKIEPRMQEKSYHKNGQWSYADQFVFVPEGSLILQSDQSTHGSRSRTSRLWVAVAGRPTVFEHWGKWASSPTFPEIKANAHVSQEVLEKVLRQVVSAEVLSNWESQRSIQAI